VAWSDTFLALFAESDSEKEKAKQDFLASLNPPNPNPLPLSQVIPLADAMTKAAFRALLKHIGPVSSDGSVTFGTVLTGDTPPIPQLDIRASSGGIHSPIQSVTTVGGVMTPVTVSKSFEVYGAEDFLGIDGTGYSAGDVICLVVRAARRIRSGATVTAPVLPFELTSQGTEEPQDLITDSKFRISFMLYGGAWLQFTPPVTL
jgi:hypothetical protein